MRRAFLVLLVILELAAPGRGVALGTSVFTMGIDAEPRAGVVAQGRLWAIADRPGSRVLLGFDAASGRRVADLTLATGVTGDSDAPGQTTIRPSLTLAAGALWTVDPSSGDALRIDITAPGSPVVTARVPGIRYVAAGPAGLWGAAATGPGEARRIVRLDPADGSVTGAVAYGPHLPPPREIAVGTAGVWVAPAVTAFPLLALDAATGALRSSSAGRWQLFARGGALLSTHRGGCDVSTEAWDGPLRHLLMCTADRAFPRDVARAGGAVWWAGLRGGGRPGVVTHRRVNGKGPTLRFAVGRDPVDVVPDGRAVWVLNRADRSLTAIEVGGLK